MEGVAPSIGFSNIYIPITVVGKHRNTRQDALTFIQLLVYLLRDVYQ